jgi:hypothetical protein
MYTTLLKKLRDKMKSYLQQIAERLNTRVAKYSFRKKRIGLICYCFLFGMLSIFIIERAIFEKTQEAFRASHVSPLPTIKNLNTRPPSIPDGLFQKVRLFQIYMDSLAIYDSLRYRKILQERPGIMDSVQLFMKLYFLQSKK